MIDARKVRVAMAGCGTVGAGVCEIVINRSEELAVRTGLRFEIVHVLVAHAGKKRDVGLAPEVFTDDLAKFSESPADMVVEVIGGTTTAREVVLAALDAGRPVVTANKALLAMHGSEVYGRARQRGTCVAFEASCAGGLPIIGALLHGLQANRIDRLSGIFNSTCNFVLTEMLEKGLSLADGVAVAQQRGYAEADPSLDVDGHDTAHKLTILASLAFGLNLDLGSVATTGIGGLQAVDLRIAQEMGYSCKLLGVARRHSRGRGPRERDLVGLEVRPTLVPHRHPLAGMTGTSSGVWVEGDAVGQTFYSGAGAGSLPTASGVVADMIDVASGAAQKTFSQLRIFNDQTGAAGYVDAGEPQSAYYVRFDLDPAYASVELVKRAWRESRVGIRSVHGAATQASVAVVTEPIKRNRLRAVVGAVADSLQPTAQPAVIAVLTE